MYSVYQHWDPLRTCLVGRSYSPQFYSFIKNPRVRTVMERIAEETEEDYQSLIYLLEKFGVKVIRPNRSDDYRTYMHNDKILPPPMCPRDWTIMLGDKFYYKSQFIQSTHEDGFNKNYFSATDIMWDEALTHINQQGNKIINDIYTKRIKPFLENM